MKSRMHSPIFYCALIVLLLPALAASDRKLTDDTVTLDQTTVDEHCKSAVNLGCSFGEWKTKFGMSYADQQTDWQHQMTYCTNCETVRNNWIDFDAGIVTYKQRESETLAMTDEQLAQYRGLTSVKLPSTGSGTDRRVESALDSLLGVTIPATLDYTSYNGNNYMSSVKNQGSCGSCWSFAATAAYESMLQLNGFAAYDLSEEAALECSSFYAPDNRVSDCSGGYFPDVYEFLAQVGSLLESNYPYLAESYGSGSGYPTSPGICTETSRIFLGTGSLLVYGTQRTTAEIKAMLVTYGPVMVGLYANTAFSSYSSGIFSGCPTNAVNFINHAVLLYGWDSNGDWLLKNQWGTSWGESGYMTLSSSLDCGMSSLIGTLDIANKNSDVVVTMDTGYVYADWSGML